MVLPLIFQELQEITKSCDQLLLSVGEKGRQPLKMLWAVHLSHHDSGLLRIQKFGGEGPK